MYDVAGDLHAYDLVREHFAVLFDVVRHHQGAIVKTMGDAIMASFSNPVDAVRAALEMQRRIREHNRRWRDDGWELGLKVGVHEGPAMVVNANDQLDYFGQTVNIAARVQGLASADELWITVPVHSDAEVRALLETRGLCAERRAVTLKGVEQLAEVYRIDTHGGGADG